MLKYSNTRSRGRKAKPCAPDLFTFARDAELLNQRSVRSIARRTGSSSALALAIAELAGLLREGR